MSLHTVLTAATLVVAASARFLYASSYAGDIATLNLTKTLNSTYKLEQIDSIKCAPNASYITIDPCHQNLFCLNEGIVDANGSLVSYKIDQQSGFLKQVKTSETPAAPVHSTLINGRNGSQLLTVAHYAWGLTTYKVNPKDATFEAAQTFNFTQKKPGPNVARQAAPHPHQVALDPTHRYLLVPDLGSDLVRVFYVDPHNLEISPRNATSVVPGSGPRHGAFHVPERLPDSGYKGNHSGAYEEHVHYYLVTELSSTITSYHVHYLPHNGGIYLIPIILSNSSVPLDPVGSMRTFGSETDTVFKGIAASEIVIAPHSSEIIVSNRNATFFKVSNPNPKNLTAVPSDTLATFKIGDEGRFDFGELSPAGGSFPRQFSLSPEGDLIAVGLQNDGLVVIYGRDKKTGKLGTDALARIKLEGQVTSVVWGGGEILKENAHES